MINTSEHVRSGAKLPTAQPTVNLRLRLLLVAGITLFTAVLCLIYWSEPHPTSDLSLVWFSSGYWVHGGNPYQSIGPGRPFEYLYPLLYPFTALLAAVPLSFLSMHVADTVFIVVSTAVLAWALTRERLNNPQLLLFYSLPFLMALQNAQWAPLLAGAALVPWLGFLLTCKPTIGAALWFAYPTRLATLGCLLFGLLSLLLYPHWPIDWWHSIQGAPFINAPVRVFPGIAIFAAALRWRRPEARLLLALGCLPHQPILYETVPLFLIPATWTEAGILWIGSAVQLHLLHFLDSEPVAISNAMWLNWCTYLPCLLMVLRRPSRVAVGGNPHPT